MKNCILLNLHPIFDYYFYYYYHYIVFEIKKNEIFLIFKNLLLKLGDSFF